MKNAKNSTSRKVNEITKNLVAENSQNFDSEILSKLDKISTDSLNEKTVLNRSVWKSEILKLHKSEKTARRILRSTQFHMSSTVIKFAKLNQLSELKNSCMQLEKFYFDNLVCRSKFSNINEDSPKGAIIQLASVISLKQK